jgi:hypothetical protein
MHPLTTGALLGLQCFHFLFLGLHDWIPFGSLNDVMAVRAVNPGRNLLADTLIGLIPCAFGFAASVFFLGRTYPPWLLVWLWVNYGLLFVFQMLAWWVPYLFVPEPARAARYQVMFGQTHGFLPARNGIRPNTLHVTLHISTLATLIVLGVLTAQQWWSNSQ